MISMLLLGFGTSKGESHGIKLRHSLQAWPTGARFPRASGAVGLKGMLQTVIDRRHLRGAILLVQCCFSWETELIAYTINRSLS